MKFLIFIVSFAAIISAIFCSRGQRSKDGKIIGGMAIRIEEAPYQASLRFFDYHVCGAAIISKTYLITAAHCTFGKKANQLSVLVGSSLNFEGGDLHKVSVVKSHPWYNPVTFDFDVALLLLETPIKIDDVTKQEISLPFLGEYLPERTPVLVSGWGETRNENEVNTALRAVIINVSNQYQCHRKYIADGGVTNRMFCAFARDKDSCSGDSGGPVRRLSDGKLVGLVSFGPGDDCANPDYPGVYTRIATLRFWIFINSRV